MKINYETYFKFDELTTVLKNFADHFPQYARLTSVGRTEQGRDLWLMTVTDFSQGEALEKPAIWVDGNTHASELSGCQACVHLVDLLTSQAKSNARVSELLKRNTFYILPRISADGAEHVLTQKSVVRSTTTPFPQNNPKENFIKKDMDGDGEQHVMRWKDPSGFYKVSGDDPRLMVPREPADFHESDGPFYHLFAEGEFENFDGFTRRYSEPFKFDLNRMAPNDFSPKERGAGPVPMYLKEAQALAQAFLERPNIVIAVTYHAYGGYLLRPSSMRPDSELPIMDLEIYKTMGKIGQKITGYRAISVFHDFKYDPKEVTRGAWDDWHYDHRGIFSWTPEIWSLVSQAGIHLDNALDVYQNPGAENLLKVLKWCDQNLEQGSYFKEWTPFEHPQLGKVEIGGWKQLFTWINPPPKFLKAEIEKLNEFTIKLAGMSPHVDIKSVEIQKIEANVFALKVSVQNQGFLPTYVSESAKYLGIYERPLVRLSLSKDQRILQGKDEFVVKHLAGRAELLPWTSTLSGSHIKNSHEDQFCWVIQGKGPLLFEVSYHGGGTTKKTIELEGTV